MERFTVSDVIDSLGVNKFTWKIFWFLGLAIMFDGYDFMVASYTMPQIKEEWALSAAATGSLASWSIFGLVIGGALSGILSDRFGRKRALVYSVALYSLLILPIFWAPNFAFFALFRVLAGIGLGACIPIVNTVFAESVPTSRRGLFVTVGMAWWIVGWVLAGLLSIIVIPMWGWRACYLIGGLPLFYAILLSFRMPETAHWLANQGCREEALKVLERVEEIATGKATKRDVALLDVPQRTKVRGPKALFGKKYLPSTMGLWVAWFCSAFIVYGETAWLPSIMLEKGFELTAAYALLIAQGLAAIAGNSATGLTSDRIGIRRTLILGFGLSTASILLASLVTDSYGAILAVMIVLGFAVNFTITTFHTMGVEIYPTDFRNTGVSWAAAFSRLGGAVAPIIMGVVIGRGVGYSSSFLFYLIPCVIGLTVTLLLIKRETQGKSLDVLAEEQGLLLSAEDAADSSLV